MRGTLPPNPNQGINYEGKRLKEIWLAGGCFWGVQAYFARVYGVAAVTAGYANGATESPTYEEVCSGRTGHAEAVHLRYDPERVTLASLLRHFFRIIDPTARNRQGNDRGIQYRSGIYYRDEDDLPVIRAVMAEGQAQFKDPIVTEVQPLINFCPAEAYHQNYLEKNPGGYCHVDFSLLTKAEPAPANAITDGPKPGEADFTAIQKSKSENPAGYRKPDPETLRQKLTPLQYDVTQLEETEPPFANAYWDHNEPGIYAALRFIPLDRMAEEGYGAFIPLVKEE
ncbi:MAG: peptide-methionine (S)-S-oxide reductase MsrA [Firmicutes bacterium]|nr:peptide-methionine (S)-S-oxide reductase MsrA [Bacillota bacterium]